VLSPRLLLIALVLFLIGPLAGQTQAPSLVLLVVVPDGLPLDASQVERWMDSLKRERERQRLTPEELPLLRLSMARAPHRSVLEKLGLQSAPGLRTFTCRRDATGWPDQIAIEHDSGTPADQLLARVAREIREPQQAPTGATLGLLLVADPESAHRLNPFLEELGRYWLQRYGRVRPSPHPLASYDVQQPEVAQALQRAFPALGEGPYPLVALSVFEAGRPVEVLRVYSDFDAPASLVREISAARGQLLSQGRLPQGPVPSMLPGPRELALSSEQERLLLISRINETAQQLWNESKEDKTPRNQGAKRILLRVIEDSRRFLAGEKAALGSLRESLRDYQIEPLRVAVGPTEQAARLLDLLAALLNLPGD
jgi:hypothetical protein